MEKMNNFQSPWDVLLSDDYDKLDFDKNSNRRLKRKHKTSVGRKNSDEKNGAGTWDLKLSLSTTASLSKYRSSVMCSDDETSGAHTESGSRKYSSYMASRNRASNESKAINSEKRKRSLGRSKRELYYHRRHHHDASKYSISRSYLQDDDNDIGYTSTKFRSGRPAALTPMYAEKPKESGLSKSRRLRHKNYERISPVWQKK